MIIIFRYLFSIKPDICAPRVEVCVPNIHHELIVALSQHIHHPHSVEMAEAMATRRAVVLA